MIRLGINGFGRIGRLITRLSVGRPTIQLVAINSTASPEYMAYLLRYDSVHGTYSGTITYTDTHLIIDGHSIKVYRERDPSSIPWSNVTHIVEATGQFTTLDQASQHLASGEKQIIITGPSIDAPTLVVGVNLSTYEPGMSIISNASCTTNCVGPLLKILQDAFGIEHAAITTIHAVTASQKIVDGTSDRDWAAGRSGLNNIIPTSTGAMKALTKILPELEGKLTGLSFRVPVVDVSVVDLTISTTIPITTPILHQIIRDHDSSIVGFRADPCVSSDFIGDTRSCIVDLAHTYVTGYHQIKIVAYYDNEMAYSHRVLDLLEFLASKSTENVAANCTETQYPGDG